MPKPTGPQFRDAFGDDPIYSRALMAINKAADAANPKDWHSGLLTGDALKTVHQAANIRHWNLSDAPSQIRQGWTQYTEHIPDKEILHTSQDYLHAPTLRKYMTEGAPEMDPDYDDREYLPEILHTEAGTPWIDEGHHRIVASRLRGDWRTKVYGGPLMKSSY